MIIARLVLNNRVTFDEHLQFHCMFRNAVGDLNNKYKHCLIMCKQLSTQEELLTHDEMKGVTLTADKLLYLHAIDLCLNAASLEFFGKAQEVRPFLFLSSLVFRDMPVPSLFFLVR